MSEDEAQKQTWKSYKPFVYRTLGLTTEDDILLTSLMQLGMTRNEAGRYIFAHVRTCPLFSLPTPAIDRSK